VPLVADGKRGVEAIAAELGITRRTLSRWQAAPEFAAAVAAVVAQVVKQPSEETERLVADSVSFMRNALGGVGLDTPLRLGVAEKILQCLAGEVIPSDDETLATVLAASPSGIKATATAMLNATKQFADESAK
jgi:hypothetical protein